jgi:endoglucanase
MRSRGKLMFDVKRCDVPLGRIASGRWASGRGALAVLACAASSVVASACSAPPTGAAADDADATGLGVGGTAAAPMGSSNTPGVAQPSTGGAPISGTPVAEAPVPMDFVLEDFNDNDGVLSSAGFSGNWRTYSDGTGMVTPAVDTPVVPVDGAVQVTGSGFATWGVGLSVDLDTSSGQRQPADLGEYRGLKIRAKGTGSIDVELVIPATTGTAEVGGTCTAGMGCFGHYAATLALSADYTEQTLLFSAFRQPDWAASSPLDLSQVLAVNFLSRVNGGPVSIDLWLDAVSLAAPLPVAQPGSPTGGGTGVATVNDGTNPFAGRALHSDGGAAMGAYDSASGVDRELLGKVALNPAAYWMVGGDPGRAGSIVDGGGDDYTVLVAYNIPNRDCSGESAGGASSPAEYQGWIDGMASSLQGKQAAVILEPDALALSCGESTESLINYAVNSLRQNPGVAVYIDGGHSNWVSADVMAGRLRNAGIEQATGFAVNVSNFQPTGALIDYGRNLSGLLGGKPFVIDTSRNGQGARGAEWCNPAGAGLGEAPTAGTGNDAVHAFLWVKRPGESDGSCGQCANTPAGQFCTSYALELARNAVF